MPLDFVGPSILRWGGDKTTQLEFNATRTSTPRTTNKTLGRLRRSDRNERRVRGGRP